MFIRKSLKYHDMTERRSFSMEVSQAVQRARPIDVRPDVPEGITIVNTAPYPQGDHPLEKMSRQTSPYNIRLRRLLINLCGGDGEKLEEQEAVSGIPSNEMAEDLGTGIPKERISDDETHELLTGEYEFITDGQALAYEIAREVAEVSRLTTLHEMDTETDEQSPDDFVRDEIMLYFDLQVNKRLNEVLLHERLKILTMLNSLRDELAYQVIEMPRSVQRIIYITSLKNAINFIIDSVMQNGLNKSITLQLPNV